MRAYIPARPTTYRGIKMRSRLEARFAQELDEGHFDWVYEPRAFAGLAGQYLPDFMVHADMYGGAAYFEVKPTIDHAVGVLGRVQIIRESIPDALLIVIVPGTGAFCLPRGHDKWRWFAT